MFVCKTLVWPAFLKFLYFVLYIEVLVNHDVKLYRNYFSHLFFLVNICRITLSPLAFFSRCTCLDMYWCSRSKYVKSEYTSMSLRAAIGDRWQELSTVFQVWSLKMVVIVVLPIPSQGVHEATGILSKWLCTTYRISFS